MFKQIPKLGRPPRTLTFVQYTYCMSVCSTLFVNLDRVSLNFPLKVRVSDLIDNRVELVRIHLRFYIDYYLLDSLVVEHALCCISLTCNTHPFSSAFTALRSIQGILIR